MVIAWPDVTARGDEMWMAVLKKLGVVKNLNFKVGHAAIILIERSSGKMDYFDFGRYIAPRGYGRARSAVSDPRLSLSTRAAVAQDGSISNLQTVLEELHQLESATHGGGRMYFSIAHAINYAGAGAFAARLVGQGPVPYGAIAKGNNSCSRFVAQVLLAGMDADHPAKTHLLFPESLKPSPMSNVVNAVADREIYCYHNHILKKLKITRWQSLRFQTALLSHNLSARKARLLPCDRRAGSMAEPPRPTHLPRTAQWLGGIGEGAWFCLEKSTVGETYQVVKYASHGGEEYRVVCKAGSKVDLHAPYCFTYHLQHQHYVVMQGQEKIALKAVPLSIKAESEDKNTQLQNNN